VAVPRSTYRIQLRPDFDLDDAAALAPYLADLGVSHLYSSPMLEAAPGSQHGYDVVDHRRASAQLGGEPARRRLADALRAADLGLVVDVVPNHMGVGVPAANPAWWDVLMLGPQSAYSRYFDIDWSRGRVLLPMLGDADDELAKLRVEDGELRYYDHRFPLAPGTANADAETVHDHQHYELVCWRRADFELNYRRFFGVSSLAGVRVEDAVIFDATHRELLRWVGDGDVDGLRIDHPDGLVDPGGYLRRLSDSTPPGTWLVVEKVLESGESLPDWPCAGTTGYDALAEVDGVLVDPAAEPALTALDAELSGARTDYAALAHGCKLAIATGIERSEVRRLIGVATGHRATDDDADIETAIALLLAAFPVYRSYLPESGHDHLEAAMGEVRDRRPELADVLDRLAPRLADPGDELARRFQQQTGAVMAKGVEDTAYYRYARFVAANEVGGDPARIGLPPRDFHAAMTRRQRDAPAGMTTLSTHDTKRSEDVRARLAVLSELTGEWAGAVRKFTATAPLPDGSFGSLLWQTVVGAWPIERDRLHAYAEKAAREAGVRTSWSDPDTSFEAAMHIVVDRVYDDTGLRGAVEAFAARITPYGWANSLSAKLIQLAMPGVPDVYQGTELFDNSLVDPDNRRPVDFATRRDMLARIDAGERPSVRADGAAKLLVTARALRLRRDRPDLFTGYDAVPATGAAAEHVVAFDRGGAVAVATRLPATLQRDGGWRDTTITLPNGAWTDEFTGRNVAGAVVALVALLEIYPVALLARR